jgi:SAM-dependent methyltransferase
MYIFQRDRALLHGVIASLIKKYALSGKVLDVGAGSFLRYAALFPSGTDYATQDIVPSDKVKHSFVCDAAHMPARDESYDVVFSTQVLEHVPDPLAVLREATRVVRSGGHILVSCPQSSEAHEIPYDYHRFTRYALENYASILDLDVLEMEALGDFWSLLHRYGSRFCIEAFHLYDHPLLGRASSVFFRISSMVVSWMDAHMVPHSLKGKYVTGWVCLYQKRK